MHHMPEPTELPRAAARDTVLATQSTGSAGQRVILPHPHNSYWVIPDSLMAGEYPGDRDELQTRHKLRRYLECGIDAFVDLTEARELAPYEQTLAEVATQTGIDCVYRRMAIRDVDVPEHPAQMRGILDQIEQWRRQGRRVYVHCWGGVGRTGTVVGCHLVDCGMDGQLALDHLRLLWTHMSADKRRRKPESPETEAQRNYVRNWAALSDRLK